MYKDWLEWLDHEKIDVMDMDWMSITADP